MAYGKNGPWGLFPTRSLNSTTWNEATNEYYIASGYNTSLFKGDPVYVSANGTIILAVAGANNPITGVFWGCKYTAVTQGINGNQIFSPFWTAGTVTFQAQNAIALVVDDPETIYNIQCGNNVNQGIRSADLYNNADLFAGNGNTTSGLSGWVLDQTTIGNAANKQLKILRLVPVPGNVFDTIAAPFPFNNVEVVINNDYYKGGTGTAGV